MLTIASFLKKIFHYEHSDKINGVYDLISYLNDSDITGEENHEDN